VQRLIDPDLVGPKRPSSLQHEHHLASGTLAESLNRYSAPLSFVGMLTLRVARLDVHP
jgi:hypothetical protein